LTLQITSAGFLPEKIGIAPGLWEGQRMNESHKLVLSMAIAMAAVAPALAQSDQETSAPLDALFGRHEPYQAFLATLKDAVAARTRRRLQP
jgi:hypothetical protein